MARQPRGTYTQKKKYPLHLGLYAEGISAHLLKNRFEALVQELLAAEDLPTLALEKADAFDYNFMAHLMQRVTAATAQDVCMYI